LKKGYAGPPRGGASEIVPPLPNTLILCHAEHRPYVRC